VRNTYLGVLFYYDELRAINEATFPWRQIAFVDGAVTNNREYGVFMSTHQLALMGNVLDTVATEHITRFPYIKKSVISHNAMGGAVSGKHLLKLTAQNFGTSGGVYNEQIMISDNKFTGHASGWPVTLGPQNSENDERVRDVILERNWHVAGSARASSSQVVIWAWDVTIRNSLIDMSGAAEHNGITVSRRGLEPASNRVSVYNNTFYSSATGNDFVAIALGGSVANTTVKNNLAYAPFDSYHRLLSGSGTGLVASNNSSDAQVRSSPGFASGSPASPADFRLVAGSYAANAGAAVPVYSDFFRQARPQGGFDLGAAERP
jgi:hypothetical protein